MTKKKQSKSTHDADGCPNCAEMKRALVAQAKAFAPRGTRERTLNEQEAAAFLGCSTKKMQKMRQDGTGPAYLKDGRQIGYIPQDLRNYRRSCRVNSTSQADVRKGKKQK